ncbi:GNAT family N-acetyltransferase [Peribacillus cavernae]|uniref:GNAT family N-acetyltransferase n=1 Tax=Peribacillus cavernae TaxID=1674310 RepID=A0A433HLT5_9BACI|nr:GNAT family N-acetyltransferase [Peribacillus cavernae]MDQ0218934.1 putative acetyltransferase [Peribacillus cavernae]RUQ29354.1 GNAT family N-acetyltransferase [Peribacillus cavernae]
MNVLTLKESHYRETIALSEYAFKYQVPEEDIEKRLKDLEKHKLFGILENGSIAAKLHLIPLEVYLGRNVLKMAGVAGVATYPEYRRKGNVKEMLSHSLRYMKDHGYSISMLHPFSESFYRKYGWELFASRSKSTLTKSDLVRKEQVPGTVKRFTHGSYPKEMELVYHRFAGQFNGMLARDKYWWLTSTYGGSKAAVYYDQEGKAAGYMLYQIKNHKMTIGEFVVLENEARSGLWNFICQHDSMLAEVELTSYENNPLIFSLVEPRVKTEVTPYFMARIVDVGSFFKQYDFEWKGLEEEVVIHITDSFADWNNQSMLLKDGEVTMLNTEDIPKYEKAGIQIDINALAAAMFGYMRPSRLQEIGLVSGMFEEVQRLDSLLPKRQPFITDFF